METKKAMGSLYLLVRVRPPGEDSALGSLAGALLKQKAYDFDPSSFARKVSQVLAKQGAGVSAYRVSRDANADEPYLPSFAPSGMLEVKLSQPQVSAAKEERRQDYTDKAGKKQTVQSTVWVYKAGMSAEVRLISYPELKVLDSWLLPLERAEERADKEKDLAEWYDENAGRLSGQAADKLVERYLNRQVFRSRPLVRKKDDKESASAVSLAEREKWGEAKAIWTRRAVQGGDWRDYLDLGVVSEVKKDYAAAREYYSKARGKAGGDKDAKKIFWDQIFKDLDVMLAAVGAAPAGATVWFSPKMAVLPFSDETTSMEGPEMVRGLVYDALKEGGYDVMSLEETDNILRNHSITQGGQLGIAADADLCKWLGVERLFFGDITTFNEVMAGLYNKREIKGQFSLWDLKAGAQVWTSAESVVKVNTPKSFLGGIFSQLSRGLLERSKNKPLSYEASVFARQTIETLPNKAGK